MSRLHEREKLQVMLHSALQMAGELGLTSVAEGVEHIEEWRLLRQFGCSRAQGCMFTRALPALEFSQWLDAYRPQPLLTRSGQASAVRTGSTTGLAGGAAPVRALRAS